MKTETRRRNLSAWALGLALAAGWATSPSAMAQTIAESEPNEDKANATLATFTTNAGKITGNTTGSSTTTPGAASADYFLVKVADDVPGIYEYQLVITTSGTAGHIGTIRGLDTVTGPIVRAGTDVTLQTSSTATSPARMNKWYGFGGEEELYYRVTGVAGTTTDYAADLSRTTVVPTSVAGAFVSGQFTITTIGQGHTTNTAFIVLDSNYQPYGTVRNDDEGPGGATTLSNVVRNFVPGTYYLGISNANVSDSVLSPSDDDSLTDDVLDFPNVIINTSNTNGDNIAFSVSDGFISTPVAASKSSGFGVNWYTFTVVDSGNLVAFGEALPYHPLQGAMVTLTVRTDPSGANAITGVSADLSQFSLGTLTLANAGGGNWTGSFTVPIVGDGGVKQIPFDVFETGGGSTSGNIEINIAPAPPANDLCADAFNLNSVSFPYSTTVENFAATNDSVNMGGCSSSTALAGFGVWYRYTSSTDGLLKITNAQTAQNAAFAIFDPSDDMDPCNSLGSSVFCSDSQVTFLPIQSGTLYYILVANDVSTATADADELMLTFEVVAGPTNDLCSGAITLSGSPENFQVPQAGLTSDDASGCTTNTVAQGAWYKYTATADGVVAMGLNASTPDADVSIFTAPAIDPCNNLSFDSCSTTPSTSTNLFIPVTNGTVYYFLVGDQGTTIGDGVYDFNFEFLPPPANDLCTGAEVIPLTGTLLSNPLAVLATDDADVDCNIATATSAIKGVWYTITTGVDGGTLFVADTGGADILEQFYTGSCVSLTPVYCQFDDPISGVVLDANTTYYILVTVFSTSPTGQYELEFSFTPRMGACCTAGSCTENVLRSDCENGGGVYQGDGVVCSGGSHAKEEGLTIAMYDAIESTDPDLYNDTTRDLTVTQSGTVTSLEVSVDMLHRAAGDMQIELISPANTAFSMYDKAGSTAATCPTDFTGTFNGNDVDGVYVFTDTASSTFRDAVVAGPAAGIPAGSYRTNDCDNNPTSLNSAFSGESFAGTWSLRVTDNNSGFTGTLRGWSISFNGGLAPISCAVGPTPCQIADFDNMNGVDVVDLFAFLDAWFAETGVCVSSCSSDISLPTGSPDVTDLFDYLDLWFFWQGTNPCP